MASHWLKTHVVIQHHLYESATPGGKGPTFLQNHCKHTANNHVQSTAAELVLPNEARVNWVMLC